MKATTNSYRRAKQSSYFVDELYVENQLWFFFLLLQQRRLRLSWASQRSVQGISIFYHPHLVNLSLFESVDGDPGFVGADCPCMCTLYADCENYGASASAPVEKAPGM